MKLDARQLINECWLVEALQKCFDSIADKTGNFNFSFSGKIEKRNNSAQIVPKLSFGKKRDSIELTPVFFEDQMSLDETYPEQKTLRKTNDELIDGAKQDIKKIIAEMQTSKTVNPNLLNTAITLITAINDLGGSYDIDGLVIESENDLKDFIGADIKATGTIPEGPHVN